MKYLIELVMVRNVIKIDKIATICIVTVCLVTVCVVLFRKNRGYYPVPVGARQIYYAFKYKNVDVPYTVIDKEIDINKIGDNVSFKYDDIINLQHVISLKFNTKIIVPENYDFKTSIKIIVTRNNNIVFDGIRTNLKAISSLGDNGRANVIHGLYLSLLPFPIGGGIYKDISIKLVVLETDDVLKRSIDSARIEIYPNIAIDAQLPRE